LVGVKQPVLCGTAVDVEHTLVISATPRFEQLHDIEADGENKVTLANKP